MFTPTLGRRSKVAVVAGIASLVAAAAFPMLASAETASPTVTVNATPTTGLVNGTNIHIVGTTTAPNLVYTMEARVCKASAVINNSFGFNPTEGGNCALDAFNATSDFHVGPELSLAPNTSVAVDFKAPVGTQTFPDDNSVPVTITCGPANPCKIVLKLGVNGGTGNEFVSFPLTYQAPATTPGAPTGFAGTPGPTTTALNWVAPVSDGNSPLDYYTVVRNPGNVSTQVNAPATTLNVTGLTNGTPYTYTVSAHNVAGFTSPVAGPITVTPNLVPLTAPTNVVGTPGDTTVNLSWTAPSAGTPTSYLVTPYIGAVAQTPVPVAGTGTTATITGLTNGTGYTFTVQGVDAGGNGPASAASAVITPNGKYVTQVISATRPAGTLEIAEACATGGVLNFGLYPQTCAVNLGTGVLDATATYYDAAGAIQTVSVRDLRSVDSGWNVNAQVTDFTGSVPANTFQGACLGFTPAAAGLSTTPVYTQTVTAGGATTPTCVNGSGLEGGPVVMTGAALHGLGRADLTGALALKIPVSAPADTYSATLTFTVI